MSRSQPNTFVVPPSPQPASAATPSSKVVHEPRPFVIVPTSLAVAEERDLIEPHWHPTIDAATD